MPYRVLSIAIFLTVLSVSSVGAHLVFEDEAEHLPEGAPAYAVIRMQQAQQMNKAGSAEVDGDFSTAIALLTPLVEARHAPAMVALGRLYLSADGGQPLNVEKGLDLLWQAVHAPDSGAEVVLSRHFMWHPGGEEGTLLTLKARRIAYQASGRQPYRPPSGSTSLKQAEPIDVALLSIRALNYPRGVPILITLAEAENIQALQALGRLYLDGYGVPKDEKKGEALLLKAIEIGSPIATATLAGYYRNDVGGEQGRVRAAEVHLQTAKKGGRWSMRELFNIYTEGIGQNPTWAVNIPKGIAWLERLADTGDSYALSQLADAYDAEDGVFPNPAKARALLERAAITPDLSGLDDELAQFRLAEELRQGRNGPKNLAAARQWYGKAAVHGFPAALYWQGMFLAQGIGGEQDTQAAILPLFTSATAILAAYRPYGLYSDVHGPDTAWRAYRQLKVIAPNHRLTDALKKALESKAPYYEPLPEPSKTGAREITRP